MITAPFLTMAFVRLFQMFGSKGERVYPYVEFNGRYDEDYSLALSLACHRHWNSGALTKVEPAKAGLDSAQCCGDTSTHIRKKQRWTPWLVKSVGRVGITRQKSRFRRAGKPLSRENGQR